MTFKDIVMLLSLWLTLLTLVDQVDGSNRMDQEQSSPNWLNTIPVLEDDGTFILTRQNADKLYRYFCPDWPGVDNWNHAKFACEPAVKAVVMSHCGLETEFKYMQSPFVVYNSNHDHNKTVFRYTGCRSGECTNATRVKCVDDGESSCTVSNLECAQDRSPPMVECTCGSAEYAWTCEKGESCGCEYQECQPSQVYCLLACTPPSP